MATEAYGALHHLAGALSEMNWTQAAEAAGMDRQTLRDWLCRLTPRASRPARPAEGASA